MQHSTRIPLRSCFPQLKGACANYPKLATELISDFREASYLNWTHPGVGPCIASDKFDIGFAVHNLLRFAHQITTSPGLDSFTEDQPIHSCNGDAHDGQISVANQRALATFEVYAPRLREQYPYHVLHPNLDAVASTLPEPDRGLDTQILVADTNGSYAAPAQDTRFQLRALRQALLQPDRADKVKTFERTYRNRRRAVHDFIAGALRACSKVTFAHIVLGSAHNVWLKPQNPNSRIISQAMFEAQYRLFSRQRHDMLEALQKWFRKSMLGYVWRIDHCPTLGLQLSLLLGMNGHKHPHEGSLISEVGGLWLAIGQGQDGGTWWQRVRRVTEGLEYDQLGLFTPSRLIHVSQQVSQRLCHADRYFKLTAPHGINSFRKYLKDQ
ncbi:hypothetical protein [Hydrogenophaga aquatica]